MKKFWKGLLTYGGLLVLVAGVAHLGYTVYTGIQTNGTLVISTALVLGGLILYVLLNKLAN
jgi:hypothetical protein